MEFSGGRRHSAVRGGIQQRGGINRWEEESKGEREYPVAHEEFKGWTRNPEAKKEFGASTGIQRWEKEFSSGGGIQRRGEIHRRKEEFSDGRMNSAAKDEFSGNEEFSGLCVKSHLGR